MFERNQKRLDELITTAPTREAKSALKAELKVRKAKDEAWLAKQYAKEDARRAKEKEKNGSNDDAAAVAVIGGLATAAAAVLGSVLGNETGYKEGRIKGQRDVLKAFRDGWRPRGL